VKVLDVNFISLDLRKKLIKSGIEDLGDLACLHASPRKCFELSQEARIPVEELHEIVSMAIFSRIEGVGVSHSTMLVRVGIDSIDKLARSNGEKVYRDMNAFGDSCSAATSIPNLLLLERWIKQAKFIVNRQSENSPV